MKRLTILFILLCLNHFSFAQTSLVGKVTDSETGEDLIGTNVILEQNGVFTAGTVTGFNGNYKIDIDPGTYDVKVTMIGYPENLINNVIVKAGQENKVDVQMQGNLMLICYFGPIQYPLPLIEIDNTSSGLIQTNDDIQNSPSRNVNNLIISTPGVSPVRY